MHMNLLMGTNYTQAVADNDF